MRCLLRPRSGMLMRALVSSAVLGSVGGLGGCSLQNLDDFPLAPCANSDECGVLNDQEQVPAQCRVYVCRTEDDTPPSAENTGTCQRLTDTEVCDGTDNDCDGIVDEGNAGVPVLGTADAESVSNMPADFVTVANQVTGSSLAPRIVWNDSEGTTSALLGDATSALAFRPYRHGTVDNDSTNPEPGAFHPGATADMGFNPIFADARAAESSVGTVATYISRFGCEAGMLRMGIIDPATPDRLFEIGPARRSNTYLGIMPIEGTPCSANRSAACMDSMNGEPGALAVSRTCGLSRPQIGMEGNEGVAAFLGTSTAAEGCSGAAVDVMAFSVFARPSANLQPRVEVSDEGQPLTLGQTRSYQRPSVVPVLARGDIDHLGFLVGHVTTDGNYQLDFIPNQPAPPLNDGFYVDVCSPRASESACLVFDSNNQPTSMVCEWTGTECVDNPARPPVDDGADPTDRTGVEIPAIAGHVAVGEVDLGGAAADGSMTVGRDSEGNLIGLVAYRTSCDEAGSVRVRRFVINVDGDEEPTGVGELGAISTAVSGELFGVPSVAYAPRGITVSSSATSAADTSGGFTIVFAEPSKNGVSAVRVPQDDDAPLDDDASITVATTEVADVDLELTDADLGLNVATSTGVRRAVLSCTPE